ncbi:hypothetical protein [Bacillus massiliglaciei]|uniref:Uncharacterized protein n=1 Tax=Peribacillus simplex TaxID=1478 RepID=A0AAN2PK59_9BACI|nr:hypothetical protein [Bacillus massiliglaciei]PAL04363.1 hypothetical protein B8W99_26860 [Peribacillus simplex]PRA73195.1 hypothetical protein CQ056_28505 [Peribacillus simplex]CEG33155.1 hypothetical protein BN1180_03327 [Peribacillus simplex]
MEIIANEYIIYIPYTTVDALEKTVYDILGELDNEADMRNCFIEAEVYCDELDSHGNFNGFIFVFSYCHFFSIALFNN